MLIFNLIIYLYVYLIEFLFFTLHEHFILCIFFLILNNYNFTFFVFLVSYEESAITYVWKNDEGTLRKSPSLTTLNAYLVKNGTIICPKLATWRGNIILYALIFFIQSTLFHYNI